MKLTKEQIKSELVRSLYYQGPIFVYNLTDEDIRKLPNDVTFLELLLNAQLEALVDMILNYEPDEEVVGEFLILELPRKQTLWDKFVSYMKGE